MNAQHKPGRHIKHPIYKGRDLEGICVLAGLVGYDVNLDGIELLTSQQQRELELWAERTHLRASDNRVHMPPRPTWLPGGPWQGPEDQWGRGPSPVDCAAIAVATGSAS